MNRIRDWFKRHWLITAIAVVGILVIAGAGWLGYRTRQNQQAAAVETPPTVAVSRGEVVLSVTAPGLSISTRTQTLASHVDGIVAEVLVYPGQIVQAGQAVVRLGDRERFTSATISARLAVLQAESALEDLRSEAPQNSARAQQAVVQAQEVSVNLDRAAAEERSQAQLALVEAQKALDHAQRNREKMNHPRSADPLVIEQAETDYLLAKQSYKDASQEFNRFARKKLTNPDRVRALNILLAARQDMDAKFARYNWLFQGYSEAEIAQANAEMAVAEANLQIAQAEWDRLEDGLGSSARQLAEANLALAQREQERLIGGAEPVGIKIARATLAQAQAALVEAEADLASLEIRAPFDGIILDVPAQVDQTISQGSALVTLIDPAALQVRATVVEEDLPLIVPGQPVDLFFDALPEASVSGKLDRIIPQRDSDTLAIYPVYISLEQVPEHLAAGMTVDASVVIAEQQDVLRLPRALVHAHSDGSADVNVWLDGRVVRRKVQVGLRGDSFIEIVSGLSEGDLVIAQ